MAHDVFVSYSSKDKVVADAVCARLESRGVRCWIAPRDVQPGINYGAAIIDAIHGSRVMVLVLSSSANASPHIPHEIERAVSAGVTILPFRIEDVTPAKSLDLFIGSVHWLDALTPPLDRHLDHLAESVLKLLPELPRTSPPPPLPAPAKTDLSKILAAAAAVIAVLVLGVYLLGRDKDTASTPGASAQRVPSSEPAVTRPGEPNQGRPANQTTSGGVPGAVASDIVGCWQWSNNATVVIRADGTMTAGPFTGHWRRGSGRSYTFTWPEPVDTLGMSADGRHMNGGNQYGVAVTASRVSGGPDVSGIWRWGDVATVVLDASGSVSMGPLTGSWVLADRGRRIYRVTWPKIQDSVTLSDDLARIQGANQYGVAVSGARLPGCG